MHPAFSVIFLTTLIGVGQGLFLALFTSQLYSLASLIPVQNSQHFYGMGSLLALAFSGLGLFASVFHLGRPERAWRAATQWRTSWLAREVIALPAFMFFVALYGVLHYVGWTQPLFVIADTLPVDATLIVGTLAMIAAFALFLCTGMVYACMKFLQEWASPLTVANYTLLGLASGFTFAAAFSAYIGNNLMVFYAQMALVLTLLGALNRFLSLYRNKKIRHKSSVQSAVGIRHNHIEQKSMGMMGGAFNTREFFHGKTELFVKSIKYIFIIMVFVIPTLILAPSWFYDSYDLPFVAFIVQYIGLLAERWYFFAEARHPQNIYYQYIG